MNNIEIILKLMEPELTELQLAKLKNVLTTILRTSRNAPPNDQLIERFIQHKRLIGLKETTLKSYVQMARNLNKYIDKNFTDITTADLKEYLSWYVDKSHIQASTLQTLIRGISSFFDFLTNEEYIDRNPTDKIERIIVEKKLKKAFTEEEIDRLRDVCDTTRDRAIVEFLYSTGARISEVIALDVKDINFNSQEVIVFGKGHKERIVYLSDLAAKKLQEYLEERAATPDQPLFTRANVEYRMSIRGIQVVLKDLGLKANVENVHPHRFRRTLATHLMDRGMPIEQIKEVLGHAKLDTTMIYCNVNTGKVKAGFKEAFNGKYDRDY